jgi:peptide/nickel transport system substrate-binding protein
MPAHDESGGRRNPSPAATAHTARTAPPAGRARRFPRRWRAASLLAAAAATALGLAACGSSAPSASSANSTQLTVSGNSPGPIPRTFNPFVDTSGGELIDATPMIYESLLQFDDLKPGTVYPWLAASYQLSNGGKTLTFDLRKGVKWTNGTLFTSRDVVYSLQVLQKYPQLNLGGVAFKSVRANGPYQVVVQLAKPDYPQLYLIGSAYIVPEQIWKSVNPVKFGDPDPVGTGPYEVSKFSPQQLTLTRNPHYWKGEPAITQLNYPAYDSADTDNLALTQGKVNWAGNYLPSVKKTYVDTDPTYHHYWFAPLGGVALIPNLTVWPLNNVDVRKAISDAVNRSTISVEGESTYEAPFTSPTGLVLPEDSSYLPSSLASLRYSQNAAQAKSLLRAAGLKMGSNGYFLGRNGKPLTLTIVDPSDYSDYMTDAQIMEAELKAVGIDVTISGVSVSAWTSDMASGSFQLTILYSSIGPSPYYAYDGWLDDSLTAPVGKTAAGDYGRWKSAATQAALADYTTGVTAAQRTAGIEKLESIMVQDEPVIPLVYSAVWFEYDNQYITGWPTPSNPYSLGEPAGSEAELVVLHLHSRS